jgi:hypothetical protein
MQGNVVRSGEGDGGGEFFARQAGRIGYNGEHVFAEDVMGFVREIG